MSFSALARTECRCATLISAAEGRVEGVMWGEVGEKKDVQVSVEEKE